MSLNLSLEVVNHINSVIDNEIKVINENLKNIKYPTNYKSQIALTIGKNKIKMIEDLRVKLLTENIEETEDKLDHDSIIGGHMVFPNLDILRMYPVIVSKIDKKFELFCVENDRKLKLKDSVSIYYSQGDKVKELFCVIDNIISGHFNGYKVIEIYIDEIVVTDPENCDIDISIL